MDLPALLERAPELALIDELAHSNAPGRRAREALRGHRRRAGRGHRRVLDRQRPAPREPQRPGGGADRDARARDGAGLGHRGRRRDRPRRPHARGADRAPAGRQGLPAGAGRGRAQPLLPDREPVGAARGRAARGRRGGRDQAAGRPAHAARHTRGRRRGAAGGPGAPARPRHTAVPASRPARRALGAAARRRARPALRPALRTRAQRGGARAARGPAPARLHARGAPAARGGRRRRRDRRPGRARARHDLRADGRPARAAAGCAACREPLHDRLLKLLPGVDLRIVADRAERRSP